MNDVKKLSLANAFVGWRCLQIGWLVLGAALLLAGFSARAAIESQLIDYGTAANPDTAGAVELSYKDFNPALGTLTGVEVIFNSYDAVEAEVLDLNYNQSKGYHGGTYQQASVSGGTETVEALGISDTSGPLRAGPFSGRTKGLETIAGAGPRQHLGVKDHVAAADFSSFIGTQSTPFSLLIIGGAGGNSDGKAKKGALGGPFNTEVTGRYIGRGGENVKFESLFDSYGTVEIEYFYTPAIANSDGSNAIPEAAEFSLFTGLAAGLAGLGGMLLWFRRSAA